MAVAQPTGALLPSQGAGAGDFELFDGAFASPAAISAIDPERAIASEAIFSPAAIGLVHTGSLAPTIRLVEKKTASRIPKWRLSTVLK